MTIYEPYNPQTFHQDDEIDLRQLFATLWSGKWLILVITILFGAGGVAYAFSKPDIYQASALLAPADGNGTNSLGGQLGGLASLAGVNIGQDSSNKTVLAREIIQSRAFLTGFIHRHNLAVPLMGTSGWNHQQQEWTINWQAYNPETGEWKSDENAKHLKPTDWDLVKKFKEAHLSVSENKANGMVTVSIKSQSPAAAKQWADQLVQDINEHMRTQDVEEAEARVDYLQEKLNETHIAGMQQVFYQLIENETRTVMLANAQKEYVFKTVDPAVVPQEKSEPKRALIAIVATMLGGMLGVLVIFIRSFIRSGQSSSRLD